MVKIYCSYGDDPAPEGFEKRKPHEWDGIPSGEVDEITLMGVYEKEENPKLLMSAVHGLLRPGGKCTVISPYYASSDAWLHPDNIRGVSELSLNWTNRAFRENAKWSNFPDINFEVSIGFGFDPAWNLKSDDARNLALTRNINVAKTIHIILVKK